MRMTVKMKVKDKLEDDTLDLSFCDLQEVPIREIATIKKASRLDLSNNQLTSVPNTIVTLTNIIKLDLSKNMLTEIPENIGDMRQLRHLDLYSNQISRLPLSLGNLKNLKWLDLKDNPLTTAVASVAGMCSNSNECQMCARNIVAYLSSVKQDIEEERTRRMNAASASACNNETTTKKESKKKKKKKSSDKEVMSVNNIPGVTNSQVTYPNSQINKLEQECTKDIENGKSFGAKCCSILCKIIYSTIVTMIIIGILIPSVIVLLPRFDETLSRNVVNYLELQTKLPVTYYQQLGITKIAVIVNNTLIVFNESKSLLEKYYQRIADNFQLFVEQKF